MFSLLNEFFSFPTLRMSEFDDYEDVLEYVPTIQYDIHSQSIQENELTASILEYCEQKRNKKFIVSLSGGVDSMVLITILHYFEYEVIAVHINYNNREESKREQSFVETWCRFNRIPLYVKSIDDLKRSTTNRTDYESITKNIRIDLYKEVMEKENVDCVLLAHHKDDIVENIFANVCRGRNLLDLAVIKKDSVIHNIHFGRPMNDFYKDTIYEFAHMYQVPYFKDTTPTWSVRGKYRNVIYPKIEDAFTPHVKENLIGLRNQSNEWNELVEMAIIAPFMNSVEIEDRGINTINTISTVTFHIDKVIDYPACFWNVVFMKLFNQFGRKCPSKKSIQSFMTSMKTKNEYTKETHNITLTNQCKCTLKNRKIRIQFL